MARGGGGGEGWQRGGVLHARLHHDKREGGGTLRLLNHGSVGQW